MRHVRKNLQRLVCRSRETIECNAFPMAHNRVFAAFDQQRRSMYARRNFPSPAEDNTLHIQQVAETDVLVRQRVDPTPRDELQIARTFFQTLANETDHWLAMSESEVRHQAQAFETRKLAEIEIQSQS